MRGKTVGHVFFVGLIFAPFFSCFEDDAERARSEAPVAQLDAAVVKGVVIDQRTKRPVKGAVLSTVPATVDAVTDDEGRFRLAQRLDQDAEYTLIATAPGYDDVQIAIDARAGEVVMIPVALAKSDAVATEAVTTLSTTTELP
jgi:hypothetical protein